MDFRNCQTSTASPAEPGGLLFLARYYGSSGLVGFFQELDAAVATLRQRSDVRIFNLSANFQSMADPDRYSPMTAELDAIADAHDAIFVISAGNAEGASCRQEWPSDPMAAMATLAAATQDRVHSPAESIRNMSVGALNPPHLTHVIGHAPAAYSRRGPALTAGLKPDVAHVGGCNSASQVRPDQGFHVIPQPLADLNDRSQIVAAWRSNRPDWLPAQSDLCSGRWRSIPRPNASAPRAHVGAAVAVTADVRGPGPRHRWQPPSGALTPAPGAGADLQL
jgi:hypothetical protein